MKIAASGLDPARWSRGLAVASIATLCGLGCGPGVATPVPEPPTLNLARVGRPSIDEVAQPSTNGTDIHGAPGAAPGGALLRITNLDSADPASVVNVKSDGSFDATIVVTDGQELRFDWSRGDESGPPEDARFVVQVPSFRLEPSTRLTCLQLTPGFVVDFAQTTQQTLTLANHCSGNVSLAAPRFRVGLVDFTLQTPLPIDVAPGEQASLELGFERAQASAREDTLFFDVESDGSTVRYPITLLAPASP